MWKRLVFITACTNRTWFEVGTIPNEARYFLLSSVNHRIACVMIALSIMATGMQYGHHCILWSIIVLAIVQLSRQ